MTAELSLIPVVYFIAVPMWQQWASKGQNKSKCLNNVPLPYFSKRFFRSSSVQPYDKFRTNSRPVCHYSRTDSRCVYNDNFTSTVFRVDKPSLSQSSAVTKLELCWQISVTTINSSPTTVASSNLCNTLSAEHCQPDIEFVTIRQLLNSHLFKCNPGPTRQKTVTN